MIKKKLQIESFLNFDNFNPFKAEWDKAQPFNHIILENFLENNLLNNIVSEFPDFSDNCWKIYNSPLETKKLTNHWDNFKSNTYLLFQFLNSREFIQSLEILTECDLFPDFGLNGGGLHTHKSGGHLNVHMDYSIHPKLKLQRKLNLIIYITPNWKKEWGGQLGLYAHNKDKNMPGDLIKSINPTFNSAILFNTTQNSWHGLPEAIKCPKGITRNSLAVYYLCQPNEDMPSRKKALFAPYKEQISDTRIHDLIKKRSEIESATEAYSDNRKTQKP
jgi:Rps23 Pro-64 3,4-dihydroxylase Tpa1-like proline 4-hydroxylase